MSVRVCVREEEDECGHSFHPGWSFISPWVAIHFTLGGHSFHHQSESATEQVDYVDELSALARSGHPGGDW